MRYWLMRYVGAAALALVLSASLPALPLGPAGTADAQAPPTAVAPVVSLRYVGADPFGSQSAVFVAQVGNSSDQPLTNADVTIDLGYRWALANSLDWQCLTDADLDTRCTRRMSVAAHSAAELPIVMISAAGVCLTAKPILTLAIHSPAGDSIVSSSASEPPPCPGETPTLPTTGEHPTESTHRLSSMSLVAAGLMLVAGGAWIRARKG